jgi:hypothetical protein
LTNNVDNSVSSHLFCVYYCFLSRPDHWQFLSARPIPTDEELKAAITGGVHEAPAADSEAVVAAAAAGTTTNSADSASAGTTVPASGSSVPATDAAAAVSVGDIALVESTSVQLELTALSSVSGLASSPSAAAVAAAASTAVAESSAPAL